MSNVPLYTVITLAEAMQDPSTRDWLTSAGVHLPAAVPPGRMPSPNEMRTALENSVGLAVNISASEAVWQATVISRKDVSWASLRFQSYQGDADRPQPFCFEGGWDELIVQVASRLARFCGPLVLLHDSGAAPQVIY
jgi:hypothetical protein